MYLYVYKKNVVCLLIMFFLYDCYRDVENRYLLIFTQQRSTDMIYRTYRQKERTDEKRKKKRKQRKKKEKSRKKEKR